MTKIKKTDTDKYRQECKYCQECRQSWPLFIKEINTTYNTISYQQND